MAVTADIFTPEINNTAKSSFYRPELDVLRFGAFLSVFVYHTLYYRQGPSASSHLPAWLAGVQMAVARGGAYGVDLFFALSAYLITELLLREKEDRGSLDVKAFYIRRILRIWPLYYFFVPLVAVAPFLNPDHSFSLKYVLPFLLLAGNWSTIAFGPPFSAALPLWSVSVEEQFYLLWPPLVARLSRRGIAFAALGMLFVANVARVVVLLLHGIGWDVWANTFARLDPMAVGILLAVFLRGGAPKMNRGLRVFLICCGIATITVVGHLAVAWGDGLPWLGTLVSYPVVALSSGVILLAFIGMKGRFGPLTYLGKISYGLYVYHQMCIWIAEKVIYKNGAFHDVVREVLALGLTILVSAVSYSLLEKPFLRLKEKFTLVRSRPV